MARKPSKHLRAPRPLGSSHASAVTKADGGWVVRTVAGAAATKTYRCPGCQQPIPVGFPHLVAWPEQPGLLSGSAVAERRHWHTACWQRRP